MVLIYQSIPHHFISNPFFQGSKRCAQTLSKYTKQEWNEIKINEAIQQLPRTTTTDTLIVVLCLSQDLRSKIVKTHQISPSWWGYCYFSDQNFEYIEALKRDQFSSIENYLNFQDYNNFIAKSSSLGFATATLVVNNIG